MIIAYVEDPIRPQRRIGGFYQTRAEIEKAADLLEVDVVVPPRCDQGLYMVPATIVDVSEIKPS